MATLLGPWSVQYPINFVANGDTVHQGFYKHIQEITRIYGLLNALDSGKVTTTDLTSSLANYVTTTTFNSHVNSASPHPNLTLGVDKITGNWPTSRISGNWDLSKVTGTLAVGKINGLEDYVKGISSGITDVRLNTNGYVKFGNGLIIQWGAWAHGPNNLMERIKEFAFNIAFPSSCLSVVISTQARFNNEAIGENYGYADVGAILVSFTKNACRVIVEGMSGYDSDIKTLHIPYIAIGY